jgi:hypothetical protein
VSEPGRRIAASFTLAALVSCGGKAPPPASGPLGGAVARVGSIAIAPAEVRAVAKARGVPPREALDDLVDDALAAQAAEARGLRSDAAVAWQTTTATARQVPARLASDAAARGAPSDDELSSLVVVHAVVLRSPGMHEEDATLLLGAVLSAVRSATTADGFLDRATAVPHPHATLTAEKIGPFRADGAMPGGGTLDLGFVAAAFALHAPHAFSPVVASPFGWHLIQLVERTPPSAEEAASLRAELAPAVVEVRARGTLQDLLRELHGKARVETAASADDLMARVNASP